MTDIENYAFLVRDRDRIEPHGGGEISQGALFKIMLRTVIDAHPLPLPAQGTCLLVFEFLWADDVLQKKNNKMCYEIRLTLSIFLEEGEKVGCYLTTYEHQNIYYIEIKVF